MPGIAHCSSGDNECKRIASLEAMIDEMILDMISRRETPLQLLGLLMSPFLGRSLRIGLSKASGENAGLSQKACKMSCKTCLFLPLSSVLNASGGMPLEPGDLLFLIFEIACLISKGEGKSNNSSFVGVLGNSSVALVSHAEASFRLKTLCLKC